ncbi:MAG: hypothetical protein ABIP16_01700 [Thermomonas sp.]
MKATMTFSLIVMLVATGCSDKPAEEASVAISDAGAASVSMTDAPLAHSSAADAPSWEIGDDIAGKTVMIDGKQEVIPADMADAKHEMDAAAQETLDAMDALEKQRLARFNDPDMQP